MDITTGKPEKTVTLTARSGHKFMVKAVIDTGADLTIISAACWQPQWLTESPQFSIAGIRGTQATKVSRDMTAFTFPDGVTVSTWPFVTSTSPKVERTNWLCFYLVK